VFEAAIHRSTAHALRRAIGLNDRQVNDPGDARRVTTWAGLRQRGVTSSRIRAQLASRRWQRLGYAIVLHNGPLSERQRWRVALVHAGPRGLLTAFTGAQAFGLRGWERETVHVLAPSGTRVRQGCPVPMRLHVDSHWDRVRRHRDSVVQALPDALLRAAVTFDSARPACGILAAAVQQRLATPESLRAALVRAPRARHRAVLIAAVEDIEQGAQALSEIDFARLCRLYRLPEPQRQVIRVDASGRRRYLDAVWRRRDGRMVVVEVDGALHLAPGRWWEDQLRQNELTLGDALVLRFPSVVVRTEPALVAAQLRRALEACRVPSGPWSS
jgi:hypothetical protein